MLMSRQEALYKFATSTHKVHPRGWEVELCTWLASRSTSRFKTSHVPVVLLDFAGVSLQSPELLLST